MNTGYRCAACGRERLRTDGPPLTDTLTAKYKRGRCYKCRVMRFFEPVTQDAELGRERKERGMGHAEVTQAVLNPDWKDKFDATVHALALQRVPFTSEDVTARVGLPPSGSGSAVGARMNAAAKRGLISWTGQMRPAERPNQNAALLKVWRGP